MLLGSLVNGAAILAGSAVGLFLRFILRRSSRRNESENGIGDRLQKIVMQGLALCTMYIGISGSLKGQNTLLAILSLVIGAVIGEILDLDGAMNRAGNWVQKKVTHPGEEGAASTVAEGFVTASLLFGVGAMSIVGSLNSGRWATTPCSLPNRFSTAFPPLYSACPSASACLSRLLPCLCMRHSSHSLPASSLPCSATP